MSEIIGARCEGAADRRMPRPRGMPGREWVKLQCAAEVLIRELGLLGDTISPRDAARIALLVVAEYEAAPFEPLRHATILELRSPAAAGSPRQIALDSDL